MQYDWGQLPGADGFPANPCGDPPDEGGSMRAQDVRTPGDPTGLFGAIVRVDPATGAGAPGNPFAGGDAGARRLIAYGLRKPVPLRVPAGDQGDLARRRRHGGLGGDRRRRRRDRRRGRELRLALLRGRRAPRRLGRAAVPGAARVRRDAARPPLRARPRGRARRRLRLGSRRVDLGHRVPARLPARACRQPVLRRLHGRCIFELRAGEDGRRIPRRWRLFARAAGGSRAGRSSSRPGPAATSTTPPTTQSARTRGRLHRIRQDSGGEDGPAIPVEPGAGRATPRRRRSIEAPCAAPALGGRRRDRLPRHRCPGPERWSG